MRDKMRRLLLPTATLGAAMIPVLLGYATLTLSAIDGGTNVVAAPNLVFRVSCAVFGLLAVTAAIVGLRSAHTERLRLIYWAALGMGLGETLPIWWALVQLFFELFCVIFGLFFGPAVVRFPGGL